MLDQRTIGSVLPAIKQAGANSSAILAGAKRSTLHCLSPIIPLIQLPQSCYRDPSFGIPYIVFDPLALHVALHAIELNIPQLPDLRYRHAYHFWFHTPLEHAKALAMHEHLTELHD
jgi:uncharacterized protein (DUF924 family)